MRRLISLVAGVAVSLLLAACGGDGDAGGSGAASVAPASTAVFVSIDTDFDGDQWRRAEELVKRFPGGREALQSILGELESEDVDFERDVKPALGPELVLVWLDLEDDDAVVLLTQPRDDAKLRELVQKGDDDGAVAEVGDWTAAAESQEILDRFDSAREGDALDESDEFEHATEDLPEDALAIVYVSGKALTEDVTANADMAPREREVLGCFLEDGSAPSFGAALTAEDDGLRIAATGTGGDEDAPESDESDLAEEIPSGATSFLSVNGLGDMLRERIRCVAEADEDAARGIAQLELGLGVSLDEDILPLFAGETVIAGYPPEAEGLTQAGGPAAPVAVLVTEVEDEDRAREIADKIAARASAFVDGVDVQDANVAGVEAKQVTIRGQASLFYAAFEGKLVVASTEGALAAVAGDAGSLAEDEGFKKALETAGAPDETSGLVYLDFSAVAEQVLGLGVVPPEVQENLEPLRSFLLWGDVGDDAFSVEAFLQID